jgi:PPM family protein phosphatase
MIQTLPRETIPTPAPITLPPRRRCRPMPGAVVTDPGRQVWRPLFRAERPTWSDAALCHIGRRRMRNEDAWGVERFADGAVLAAVADGMGGLHHGDQASEAAVTALFHTVAAGWSGIQEGSTPDPEALLRAGIRAAQEAVRHIAAGRDGYCGTTLTAAFVRGEEAWLVHTGDSRGYATSGDTLLRLTRDHNLFETMRELELMPEQEARRHPGGRALVSALGIAPDVDIDLCRVPVSPGERLLLCSDGLWEVLGDPAIGAACSADTSPADTVQALTRAALQRGGRDNITAVVLQRDREET